MPWFWRSRAEAEQDNSAMYAYGSKDAIKDFVERHGGAATGAIIDYMDRVYGLGEGATREHLSDLSRAGELAPRVNSSQRGGRGREALGYGPAADDDMGDGSVIGDWG